MESTPRKPRKLNGPQGVQKSIAGHNRLTPTIACQSCHTRKKRCVYVARNCRCTNCFQEEQPCLPRGHVARAIEEEPEDLLPETSHHTFNLPLPRGIDHEVPRWAAVYSMVQEVLHFLPPEDIISDQHDDIKVPENDETNLDVEDPERSASHPSSSYIVKAQGDAEDTASAIEDEPELSLYRMSAATHWNDYAVNESFEIMATGNSNEGLDLDDIDALLRF
ncbi:hypothetical protein BDV33DRAFT_173535 [Aspergillus novoparasiticus]|uniref:Zn(2)-C6 fungal-type domain-containing protein n=1 Tax=Aspergillus novoparasiticus TaxID=986946 RepID=A0A5N6ERN3_9EURO|nr:hypothetical protein BDV33DRAFT_173535 [Aspergillus novoparasiticus]